MASDRRGEGERGSQPVVRRDEPPIRRGGRRGRPTPADPEPTDLPSGALEVGDRTGGLGRPAWADDDAEEGPDTVAHGSGTDGVDDAGEPVDDEDVLIEIVELDEILDEEDDEVDEMVAGIGFLTGIALGLVVVVFLTWYLFPA